MATFYISVSIEVEADSYEEAYTLENMLTDRLRGWTEVKDVCSIDVEHTDGDLAEDLE